jgi:hypothetical protein
MHSHKLLRWGERKRERENESTDEEGRQWLAAVCTFVPLKISKNLFPLDTMAPLQACFAPLI